MAMFSFMRAVSSLVTWDFGGWSNTVRAAIWADARHSFKAEGSTTKIGILPNLIVLRAQSNISPNICVNVLLVASEYRA